jgi:hypothetical protein
MGAKIVKFRQSSGRKVEVKSIRLPNGNLVIPNAGWLAACVDGNRTGNLRL